MKNTKIIAFVGLDGSGKSSQIKSVKKILEAKGYRVKVQQHFTLPIGIKCEEILKKSKDAYIRALTFALDEYAQKLDNEMDADYDIILCDRSHYCAYAYSGAQGISCEWIKEIYKYSQQYDMCIYLDISTDTSCSQKGFDAISPSLSQEQFARVREIYLELVQKGELMKVNAEQRFEKVTEDISLLICEALKK